MHIITSVNEMKSYSSDLHKRDEHIAFVPTMGNLHAGHMQLVEKAETLAPKTVVSIFVNPLQFGANEDFSTYPRTFEHDRNMLELAGVDILFAPNADDIYPDDSARTEIIEFPGLSDVLCGEFRPGHFSGVAVVVKHLFEIVHPNIAVFGEKDFQQVQVIKRLVQEYKLPVEIVTVPTQRETDGLAMSSRNGYLSGDERKIAPILYQTLSQARARIKNGEQDFGVIEQSASENLRAAGFSPEYFSVRRSEDLQVPEPEEKNWSF